MTKPLLRALLLATFAGVPLAFTACGEDEALVRERLDGGALPADARADGTLACGVAIPEAYESPSFEANAAVELALTASFRQLIDEKMKPAEASDAGVTGAELQAVYNAGAPSLRSVSSTPTQTTVDSNLGAWEAALGNTWSPADVDQDGGAPSGGRYGAAYFSPTGLALRSNTSTTLLGGALLNRVLGLVAAPVTEATVDSLVAAFGVTPAGLNAGDSGGTTELLADYAARREDWASPTPGPFRRIRSVLLTLKAAASGGDRCKDERDAAVTVFLREWERTSFGVAIGRLASAATLAADPQRGPETLAELGAAVGLVAGWKGLPEQRRKITDAQIDVLLAKIGADTPYRLVTTPGDRAAKLQEAISDIALYEGFSPAEVDAFRLPR